MGKRRAGPRGAADAPVASLICVRPRSRLGSSGRSGQWAGVLSAGFEVGLPRSLPSGAWAGARWADWPRSRAAGTQAEAHAGSLQRRDEAGGTMSGRNFHLSTTERVIKGAKRAGPSSLARGERALGRATVQGRREGAEAGKREGGGGPWLCPSRGTWRRVGTRRAGSPRGRGRFLLPLNA